MKFEMMVLAAGLTIAAVPGARAQDAAAPPPEPAIHVPELLDIFEKGCLHAFAAESLGAYAASQPGTVAIPAEAWPAVSKAIGGKVRAAWLVSHEGRDTILASSEGYSMPIAPAFDSLKRCTVMAVGPADPHVMDGFRDLKARYASQTGMQLKRTIPATLPAHDGMGETVVEVQTLADGAGSHGAVLDYSARSEGAPGTTYKLSVVFLDGIAKK